jgi:hypothetical protein
MLRAGALSRQLTVNGKASHCYQGYKAKGAPPILPDSEQTEIQQDFGEGK